MLNVRGGDPVGNAGRREIVDKGLILRELGPKIATTNDTMIRKPTGNDARRGFRVYCPDKNEDAGAHGRTRAAPPKATGPGTARDALSR
jgi:hypothetical protein